MTFTYALWVKSEKLKQEEQNQDTLHFENAIYRVLHERSNNPASFGEPLKFQEKVTFTN